MLDAINRFIQKVLKDLFRKKKHVKLGLYGPPNGGKCVTPDTEVVLANGKVLPIKALFDYVNSRKDNFDMSAASEVIIQCDDLGLHVPSFDTKKLEMVNKRVTHLYAQKYSGTVFQIRTSSGRMIKTTPVHPLIRLSDAGVEKVKAADLKLKDSVAVAQNVKLASGLQLNSVSKRLIVLNDGTVQAISAFHKPKSITAPSAITSELVRFVAYVLSESYHTKNRIIFSNCDENLLADFEMVSGMLFRLQPIKRVNKGVPQMELNSKSLTDYLELSLGLKPATSEGKAIPDQFLGLPDDLIAEFLRVYADCEGSVAKETRSGGASIEIASKSKKLLEQLQLMLNRFGIVGKFMPKVVNGELYHRLLIRGSENHRAWMEKIGFSIKYKSDRLAHLCEAGEKRNTFSLPIMNMLEKIRKSSGLTQTKFYFDDKHVLRMVRDNRITPRRLKQTAEQHQEVEVLQRLANSDALWDKIVEIKEIPYDGFVYDVTIEDTHTFLTSAGIIAHNTTLANRICQDWLGEDMGIVSSIPHETREIKIKEQINIKSGKKELSFNLVDTPGIATKIDYEDFVKHGLSVKKAKERAKEATKGVIDAIKWLDDMDAVIVVLDSTYDPYSQVNITIIGNLQARNIPVLIVANKVDLKKSDMKKIEAAFPQYEVVGISAKYGKNMDNFYDLLFKLVK
ncbi:50S ribosome-binding GTPase [Candidatus Woesearchaeota archaeon]|nr:50S ribosome-binding GTPase [Candidatus Woesearchaeota archaeon]